MRDHAGAGLEIVEELGPKPQVDVGQQVEGDHGGVVDVGLEEVVFFELHQGFDARLAGVFAGMFVLATFVIVIDAIVSLVEKRLLIWRPLAADSRP